MADLSSDQESSVDEFVKERLKSCHMSPKGMITGYVDSKEAYDELMRDLKVLGCCFSVRSTYSRKTESGNLQYKILSPDLQIPFTGSPFHVDGTTYLLCTHGDRYFKSKVSTENEIYDDVDKNQNGNSPTKKRFRKVNESIKLGCPAKMTVKCIRLYPDYKTKSDSWRRKCDVLKRLKADLKSASPPRFELNFWIAVSPEESHNHERHTTIRIQPLHPDLIAEIHNLARRGVTSVPLVKSHLLKFVEKMFAKSSVHPDPLNSAFYPNDKCIYNHIHDAKQDTSKLKSRVPTTNQELIPSKPGLPSTDACAPQQHQQIDEKCNSTLAAVPVLDTFTSDWQDQPVLPSNFVQVLNNNGTLMLMVTQPLGDQLMEQVENSPVLDSSNIVNVQLDENIYTVITDASEQRILQLNNDSNIIVREQCSSHDQIREVLAIQDNNENVVLESEKNSVLSIEESVMLGVPGSPSIGDRDADDTSCHGDQSEFLFVGEDSQTALLNEVKNRSKELTDLCALPTTQSSKDEVTSLFPLALGNDDSERNLSGAYESNLQQEVLKESKCRKRTRKHSEIDIEDFEQEDSSVCKILRESAQDIISMSYSSTNSTLLQEMARVFEKYRKCLRAELELQKNETIVEHETILSTSEKSKWKTTTDKTFGYSDKSLFQSENFKSLRQTGNTAVIKKLGSTGGTVFSSSESSVDDYDDLVITD